MKSALPAGSWQRIEIEKGKTGRPMAKLSGVEENIASQDISISHDGEYVMAVAVFLCDAPH